MTNLPFAQRRRSIRAISLACLLIVPAVPSSAGTVTWAVDSSGTWTAPSNWSSNPALPGPTDDVLIDRAAGTYTVTLPSDTQSINSLVSQENLTLANATLGVATTAQIGGSLTLSGGTVNGGTWSFSGPGSKLAVTGNLSPSVLGGLTLAGTVSLSVGDHVTVQNGLTLAPGTTINLSSGNYSVTFSGTQTLAGSGDIVLTGSTSSGALFSTGTLTLAPGITVRSGTRGGQIGLGTSGTNQGTISSQGPAKGITVTGVNWVNAGTLSATAGGSLTLAGSWSNAGTISISSGSTVNLGGSFSPSSLGTVVTDGTPLLVTGSLNASSTPLTLSASSAPLVLSGGTITGTIASPDSTPLVVGKDSTGRSNVLTAATVNAPVTVPAGVGLTASGSILNQPVSVSGGGLTLTGAWVNNASITATDGGGVSLGGTPPPSLGNVSVTNANFGIASSGYTTALIRPVSLSNATLVLSSQGVLDNTGDTLTLSPSTATLSLVGGTLKGGTITGPAGAPVVFTSTTTPIGTLDGVTLSADAYVAPLSDLRILNGITLDHALISIRAGHSPNPNVASDATLYLPGTQTIAGTGTISFDGDSGVGNVLGAGLTVGPGITIRTGTVTGFIGDTAGPLVLNGTVSAETPGTSVILFGSPVTNTGTLRATNNGHLQIAGSSFTNTGTITVDPGSSLTLNNGSVPNGTIRLAGPAFVQYYAHPSPATPVRQALAAGRAGVTGIIDPVASSDPTHAIGYAEATAVLDFGTSELATFAGHTVDKYTLLLLPTFYGDANLDGKIDADDYVLIDRGYAKGLTGWVNGDFNYDNTINANDYLLIDTTAAKQAGGAAPDFLAMRESQFGPEYVRQLLTAVPEPSTLALALLTLSLASRRRRR